MRLSQFVDGYKYAVSGAIIGTAFSGVSEAIEDVLVDMAGLDEQSDAVHHAAGMVIRMTVSAGVFLLADRVMQRVGANDPTGGLFFNVSFVLGNSPLVRSFSQLSGRIAAEIKTGLGFSCCASCANGAGCEQK